jgi:D-alanine-D-alanine ligase
VRVLVLFGGRSGEHEVSVQSARSVVDALDLLGHSVVSVGITRDGRWVRWHPHAAERVVDGGAPYVLRPTPQSRKDVDVAFPVLHGPFGEDGALQGLFELADLPYVGSGIEGSSIGLNKWVHRRLFADAGLAVVDSLAFAREAWDADRGGWAALVGERLGFPCFTKPAHLGSSVGISRVADAGALSAAMDRAFLHDDTVVVEAFGGPREIEVGVLDGSPPHVSVPGEVVPAGDFYDYDSKYLTADTELRIPAELPDDVKRRVVDNAIRAFGVARAEGFARVDFFYDPETDDLRVNEINTIPGLTTTSMFPKLWHESGVAFHEVVQQLLDHAIARHRRKTRLEAARAAAHAGEVGAKNV